MEISSATNQACSHWNLS